MASTSENGAAAILPNKPNGVGQYKCRQSPSSIPTPDDDPTGRASKKQKLHHPEFPPRQYWERLSKVPLTRNSLRALVQQKIQSSQAPAQSPTLPRREHQPVKKAVESDSKTILKRVKAFARHGGPDLGHLRGYSIPLDVEKAMNSRQSSLRRRESASQSATKSSLLSIAKSTTTRRTTSTKSTGPYDPAFEQHLIDHNILPYAYRDGRSHQKPDNMDEIRLALAQPRASLSPSKFSKEDLEEFELADARACKKRDVTRNIIPTIQGDPRDNNYTASIPFTNLEHLTDGTLVPGNPDLYYGAHPEQLHRVVRQELSHYIVPSTDHDLPIVPNYMIQAKGPESAPIVARRQASYDGALGARGIHSLQSYQQSEPKYDNKAYTITSIYYDGTLKMYTSHPIPPVVAGEKPGFVMTRIKSWCLSDNEDDFRKGVAAFRNGRDWAKRQRDAAIDEANKRAACGATSTSGDGLGIIDVQCDATQSTD